MGAAGCQERRGDQRRGRPGRRAGRGGGGSEYQTNSDPAALTALQGGNPLDTWFQGIGSFGGGPDNRVPLIGASVMGILQIASSLSGFTGQELQIPAEDASEVYVFDARHPIVCCITFFFNDTATTEIYTRSLVGSVRCV